MDDLIKLKSGNEVYANNLILGIGFDLAVSQGYDGPITYMPDEDRDEPHWGTLSPDDVCELADIAIDRWNRLKAMVKSG